MAFAQREGSLDVILTQSYKFRSRELLLPSWSLNWISSSCWNATSKFILERAEKIKRIENVDSGHEIRKLHTRSYNGKWLNLMGTQLGTVQDTVWTTNPRMRLTSGHAFQQPDHLRVEQITYSKAHILNSLSLCFRQEDFERKDEGIIGLLWYAFYCVQFKRVTKGMLPPRNIESRSKYASKPFLMHGKTLNQWALYSKKEIWKKQHFGWYFQHRRLTYFLIILMGVLPIVFLVPRHSQKSVVFGIGIIWVFVLSLVLIVALVGAGYAVKSGNDQKAEILKIFGNKMNLVNSYGPWEETLKITVCKNGLLAMTAEGTMEGDVICYLAGCKHQVVLRMEKELGKWRVIGRAFVPVQDIERVIQQKNGKNYSGKLRVMEEEFTLV
ncbi:uncharacterized protein EAE97_004305 [Botrytis byssoidea]|uniref:Uncharacterized protein n=1 Tax=Botrytis byssoidea TaxID=139641 RepID=A0A9P5LW20_9HELO|nr:uncharacterized protein EAE97_004305 [Botrytis byssoidea]KAF7947056.1 hypothetical protein EAE97_004305 [Botrytis byssoidea]